MKTADPGSEENPMPLSPEDRERLVKLARAAVRSQVTGNPMPPLEASGGVLTEKRGCFVTLTNRGRLRGCIGTFMPNQPLAQMVTVMGRHAAQDPRFVQNPITPTELEQLHVEVSVLSPLTPTRQPQELQVGVHGIYIVPRRAERVFPAGGRDRPGLERGGIPLLLLPVQGRPVARCVATARHTGLPVHV